MNTPAHVILNVACLGFGRTPKEWTAVAVGGALPDVPIFAFYAYEKFVGRAPESDIWIHYFDPGWQNLFDAVHAFPLIGLATWLAWRADVRVGVFLGLSMLLHALEDLPLHHDDGHRHFFPLSDWRFASPISYWDPHHHGQIVGPLEILLVLGCGLIILRAHPWRGAKLLTGLIVGSYALFWLYAWMVWR